LKHIDVSHHRQVVP